MGFNLGAFAGGVGQGLYQGVKTFKEFDDLKNKMEMDAALKQAKQDAASYKPTEQMSGADQYQAGVQAYQDALARAGDDPAARQAVSDAYSPTLQSLSDQYATKAGWSVKGKTFDNRAAADSYSQGLTNDSLASAMDAFDPVKAAQLRAANTQQQLSSLQLDESKNIADARNNMREMMSDPKSYALKMYNNDVGPWGEGDHAGRQIRTVDTQDGPLMYLVDKDGNTIANSARHYTSEQLQDAAMKTFLRTTDPATAWKLANEDKKFGMLMQRYAQADETTRRGQDLSLRATEIAAGARSGAGGIGTPIGMSDDGSKMLFSNPRGGLSVMDIPPGFSKLFPKVSGSQRPIDPELVKAAATEYSQINPKDTAAIGAFDAKYPGLRAHWGMGAGGLRIPGAPSSSGSAPSTPAAPSDTSRRLDLISRMQKATGRDRWLLQQELDSLQ